MKHITALFVLSLIGCGAPSTVTPDNTNTVCSQRHGTYRVTFFESSGTCGYMPEQVITASQSGSSIHPSCTGFVDNSDNNCRVTGETECPGAVGYWFREKFVADWSKDGSTGNAVLQLAIFKTTTGYMVCSSVYDVVYKRI